MTQGVLWNETDRALSHSHLTCREKQNSKVAFRPHIEVQALNDVSLEEGVIGHLFKVVKKLNTSMILGASRCSSSALFLLLIRSLMLDTFPSLFLKEMGSNLVNILK